MWTFFLFHTMAFFHLITVRRVRVSRNAARARDRAPAAVSMFVEYFEDTMVGIMAGPDLLILAGRPPPSGEGLACQPGGDNN